jgi:hypothetical protein
MNYKGEKMKITNTEQWELVVKNNPDEYGSAIVRYAESWADLMESKIEERFAIEDIAEETSHQADTEGITGFMYGCAVSVLAQIWEYGGELTRWHNKDIQISNEGDLANENGGVLNPALINIREN